MISKKNIKVILMEMTKTIQGLRTEFKEEIEILYLTQAYKDETENDILYVYYKDEIEKLNS